MEYRHIFGTDMDEEIKSACLCKTMHHLESKGAVLLHAPTILPDLSPVENAFGILAFGSSRVLWQ